MRKTLLFALTLTTSIALGLTSCASDDELEVWFGTDPNTEYGSGEYQYPLLVATVEQLGPLKDMLAPTDYVPVYNDDGTTIIGYQGYVDLGLSVNWAVANLGFSPMNKPVGYDTFDEFHNAVNNPTHVVNSEYPKVMTFAEYEQWRANQTYSGQPYGSDYWDREEAGNITNLPKSDYAFTQECGKGVYWGSNVLDTQPDYTYTINITKLSGKELDAATNLWGSQWRTPSAQELIELAENCETHDIQFGGIKGTLFVGKNGKAIFLPKEGKEFVYGLISCYMSSDYAEYDFYDPQRHCYAMNYNGSYIEAMSSRYVMSVRPVINK